MNEKELAKDFYKTCRKENKKRFIELMTRKIKQEQKRIGGIDLPAFIYAIDAYNQFKKAGCFDEYGRLKQRPELLESEV